MMNSEVRHLLHGITHPDTRRIVKAAINAGIRYRLTRAGVMFYGTDGKRCVSVHKTQSDHRAVRNMIADFRKIGFDPTAKETT